MTMENATVAHAIWKATNNLKMTKDCKGSTMAMSVCDGGGTHHLGMLKPTVH